MLTPLELQRAWTVMPATTAQLAAPRVPAALQANTMAYQVAHVHPVHQARMLQRLSPLSVLTALLVNTRLPQAPQPVLAVVLGTPQMVL